jgi:hypothetical protein
MSAVSARANASYQNNPALRKAFGTMKTLLAAYEKKLVNSYDDARRYELWTGKPAVIEGRKKDSVFFASLIIQKDYVGFFFMPVYAEPELKAFFAPELLKLLKGKSCFHIRSAVRPAADAER